jgi:hypothetical protein
MHLLGKGPGFGVLLDGGALRVAPLSMPNPAREYMTEGWKVPSREMFQTDAMDLKGFVQVLSH